MVYQEPHSFLVMCPRKSSLISKMASAFKLCVLLVLSCGLLMEANAKCRKKDGICRVCPDGWTVLSSHCYLFVRDEKEWTDAELDCLDRKGNLASVHTAEEYNGLREMIRLSTNKEQPTWIGGTDITKEGCWIWTDGTPTDFTSWAEGQPDNINGTEHCLSLNSKGQEHLMTTAVMIKDPTFVEGKWKSLLHETITSPTILLRGPFTVTVQLLDDRRGGGFTNMMID